MERIIKNEMKMEFLSKSANEAFARIAVASFASQLDPTIEEIADIKTSVSEAVINYTWICKYRRYCESKSTII